MIEIEIKASMEGVDVEAVKAKAHELGFADSYTCTETDTYYNGADRDFRKTDEAFRIRSHTQDGETQTLLTYKGPKKDDISMTREELETSAGDDATIRAMLAALGFQPVFDVTKDRLEMEGNAVALDADRDGNANYEGFHACFDYVHGLGDYIELEYVAADDISDQDREACVEKLLGLLEELGVSREALTQKTYLEMLMKKAMA